MEARRYEKNLTDLKKSINSKSFYSSISSILSFIFTRFFKLLMFIIFSPLYLFMLIKNWIVIGIMCTVLYAISFMLFYYNTGHPLIGGFSSPVLWTESRIIILLIVSAILAFFATIGQFTKD
ncbi:TPA: hypothetical protein U7J85_001954 [Streptococcus agalactiae]|nr:hypothetical protein [Streptococcus agalactiae]HEN7362269.1 hypothetical protein [Streptococcus agalactiae]HEN7902723.1 hypothetical protein [Streptococcus agalactiae]